MKLSISALLAPISLLLMLGLFLAIKFDHVNPVFQSLWLILLLVIPGFLAMLALKFETKNVWMYILHSFGISIGLIYIEGLVASFGFPLLGFTRPLEAFPFIYLHEGLMVILLLIAMIRNFKDTILARDFAKQVLAFSGYLIAITFSLVSVIGAFYMNNGGSNVLSLAWLFIIVAVLFVASFFKNEKAIILRPYLLFVLSLSILWMLSARSWNFIGWDIVEESVVAKTTQRVAQWTLKDVRDAYNACLSITVMPTVLSDVTSVSIDSLYKYLYPFLFAHFPIAIYFWTKKIGSKDLSFFAVIYIIGQPFFNQSMVGLARQEVAFFFFPLILLTIFTNTIKGWTKRLLIIFYLFALVTSHYSTSYVSILIFVAAYSVIFTLLVIKKIFKRFPPSSRIQKYSFYTNWFVNYTSAVKGWMVFALVAITYIWFFLITNSGGNVVGLAMNSLSGMTNLFKNEQKSQEVRNALPGVSNVAVTTQSDMQFYEHAFDGQLENLKSDRVSEIFEKYSMKPMYDMVITPTLKVNSGLANALFNKVKDALKIILILGAFVQFIKTFRKTKDNLDLVIFSCVSAALLIVMILHPTLGLRYNIARIYLQLMVFLGFSLLVGMDAILWLLKPRMKNFIFAGVLLVSLLYLQGALVPFIGGAPVLQFYQKGLDYEKNYVFEGELLAGTWLQQNRKFQNAVYADDFSGLRIRKVAFFFPKTTVVPTVLDNDASGYVYLSNTNKNGHKAIVNFANKLLTYEYPIQYLDDSRSLIYSNGKSSIYR